MVDITKIVEKGIKEQAELGQNQSVSESDQAKDNKNKSEKTVLDDLFGDKNTIKVKSEKSSVQYSRKLGQIFGVDESKNG